MPALDAIRTRRPAATPDEIADLDRRKARIVACMHPTRINRGFDGHDGCERLGKLFGVSGRMIRYWGDGGSLPTDEQVPAIEAWLESGPVWRYVGIDRIIGPETFVAGGLGCPSLARKPV